MLESTTSVASTCTKGYCAFTKSGDYNGVFAVWFSPLIQIGIFGLIAFILAL